MIELEGAPGDLTRVSDVAVVKAEAQGGDGACPEPHSQQCRGRSRTQATVLALASFPTPHEWRSPHLEMGTRFVLTVKQPVIKASP